MLFYTILAALLVAASAFPGSICKDCVCQKATGGKLKISDCKPQLVLTSDTFQNDKRRESIKIISIEGAYIQSISENAFDKFVNLQDVVVKNTKIGSIDVKAFDKVSKVSFSNCAFEDEPVLYSDHMEELNFVQCQLTAVPKLNTEKLVSLNLTNNTIKSLDLLDFAGLKEIEEIDLSNNEIEAVPSDIFINNEELNTVNLDHNPLKEFIINTTNNIEYISLKGCKLRSFDSRSTRHLSFVSELYLNNNEIDFIAGTDMAYMGQLQVFDISYNKLTVLDPDVFENNTDLEKIYLDGNKLKFLPMFVSKYEKPFETYLFSCANCGLKGTISPIVFRSMSALFELHLQNNELTNIDDSFSKLPSLSILNLSDNKINSIGASAFTKNLRLQTLYLSGNKLTSLNPDSFSFIPNLLYIDADGNEISQLWSKHNVTIPSLKTLYVRNNRLRSISVDDLEVVPKLNVLGVRGNELDCGTALMDMIVWLSNNGVTPPIVTHMEMATSLGLLDSPVEGSLWRKLVTERCQDLPEALDQLDNEIDKKYDGDIEKIEEDDVALGKDDEELKISKADPVEKDDYVYHDDEEYDDLDLDDEEDSTSDPDDEAAMKPIIANIEEVESVRYASYILSLTTVFVLTALVVLFIAVTVILLILKKNGSINMQTANIPRFKIRSWSQATGIKKHSGSIYRPLSEDLLPQTPQLKRYEFASSPTVHSTHP